MKYACIREHRDSFRCQLCQVLEVSARGLLRRLIVARARGRSVTRDSAAVRQVHAESYGIYGSLKIASNARAADLESACRNTVAQARRELGLKSRIAKAFTPTTTQSDPSKFPAPNELARLQGTAPNRNG